MSRDEARNYFANRGLKYSDINTDDISNLKYIIQKHLDHRNVTFTDTRMFINQRNKKTVFNKDGNLVGCALTMRCHYFKSREAITFSSTGFIGFAGWADHTNVKPLTTAFCEWVDGLQKNHNE
ncbi:MAG: hypothetical protein JWM44_4191 [Bacilli bacterium]|nr:hypothetical protein [Bacilli bacterium]